MLVAKKNEIIDNGFDDLGRRNFKVKVNQPPEDGKANLVVIETVANFFNVKKNMVKIINGELSRNKIMKFMLNNFFKITLFLTLIFSFFMNQAQANSKLATSKLPYQKAILAGGCFWGMEELFRKVDGVIETRVGYIGGKIPNPNYKIVSTGLSNHAESIEITFDPNRINYEKILKFFFTIHDPTTINRQQNDIGSQYRSAIFYLNDEQKIIAENVIQKANKSGVFKSPAVTKVEKAGEFYEAEAEHQDYLEKHPYGYTCHHVRNEWKF